MQGIGFGEGFVSAPTLTPDRLAILLDGVTLSPIEARALARALDGLAREADANAHTAREAAAAAALWARAEASGEYVLGAIRGRHLPAPVPALLRWAGREWRAIVSGTERESMVLSCAITSIPPTLVREYGGRTRHWWTGTTRSLCDQYTSGRPETSDKYPICPKCAAKVAL